MSAFDPIFESGDYLSLLHISPNCAGVVERIGEIARNCQNLESEFSSLLNDGWRPALVACVALFGQCSEALLEKLWAALDRGSWVAPQMAVTLSLLDPNFPEKARQRLLSGCPPQVPEKPITAEIHVSDGPAGARLLSAKTRVCLMTLLASQPQGRDWLNQHIPRADALHDILVEDAWDESSRLVARWLSGIAICLGRTPDELKEDVLLRIWPPETPDWLAAGQVTEEFFLPLLKAGVTELEWRRDQRGTLVTAKPVGKLRLERPYDCLLMQYIERHSSDACFPTPLGNLRLIPGQPIRFVLESNQTERIQLSRHRLEESGARWLIHGVSQDGRLRSGPGAALLALAGPELEYELMARLSEQARQLGEVIRTQAYGLHDLGVQGVLHVVALETPRGCSQPSKLGDGLQEALRSCYGPVAIASMGSGGGGLDPTLVSRILVDAVRRSNYRGSITFCLPNERDYKAFAQALRA
ncbi:hypothetical protein JST97_02295 [bacterium]|nr:hypothetical protein [bacterium]